MINREAARKSTATRENLVALSRKVLTFLSMSEPENADSEISKEFRETQKISGELNTHINSLLSKMENRAKNKDSHRFSKMAKEVCHNLLIQQVEKGQ